MFGTGLNGPEQRASLYMALQARDGMPLMHVCFPVHVLRQCEQEARELQLKFILL